MQQTQPDSAMKPAEAHEWLGELFEADLSQLPPETPRQSIAGWDSLGTLSLMADLDERYNLILTEDQLGSLKTLGDLLTLLRAQGVIQAQ